jgi:hypothetical protein
MGGGHGHSSRGSPGILVSFCSRLLSLVKLLRKEYRCLLQVVNFPLTEGFFPFEIVLFERNMTLNGTAIVISRTPYSPGADIRDPLGEQCVDTDQGCILLLHKAYALAQWICTRTLFLGSACVHGHNTSYEYFGHCGAQFPSCCFSCLISPVGDVILRH